MKILSVTESVYTYLRDSIVSGDLKPGEKLNEVVISKLLSVSRPPLREALRLLENEQLVVNYARRGTYVAGIGPQNLEDIYQVREMIECFALDLIEIKNVKDLSKVKAAIAHVTELDLVKDRMNYIIELNKFHINLVDAASNPLLNHFFQAIYSNLGRYQFICTSLPNLKQESSKDHQIIYDFLIRGEYAEAKTSLRTHIRKFVEIIKEFIKEKY
jgi:DNA-binding GntR family transcriptional regulator